MRATGRDSENVAKHGTAGFFHVDRRQAIDPHRRVTQLFAAVVTPALGTIVDMRAGMHSASRDSEDSIVKSDNINRFGAVGRRSVAAIGRLNRFPSTSTAPNWVNAQAWFAPSATAAMAPPPSPTTSTGTLLATVVPLPSWPLELSPPALDDARAGHRAGVGAPRPDGDDTTAKSNDVDRRAAGDCCPLPSWPKKLSPQHLTPPAPVSAQE